MFKTDILRDDPDMDAAMLADMTLLLEAHKSQLREIPKIFKTDINLSSAARRGKLLRRFSKHEGHKQLWDEFIAVIRNDILQIAATCDSATASGLMKNFYSVSKPLGLGLEDDAYKTQIGNALIERLLNTLTKSPTAFIDHRINSVKSAFDLIDEDFTAHHDELIHAVYERFDVMFHKTRIDLPALLRETERELARLEPNI